MKIEPEGVKVLVEPDKVQEKTEGGIYLAPTTRDDEQRGSTKGIIVEIGPAAQLEFNGKQLKPGDRVAYVRYAGFSIEGSDRDLVVMNDSDIVARIN